MIGVVDYGAGNIGSVINALEHLDQPSTVCGAPADIRACQRVILPGVGHFGTALRHLHGSGMFESLREAAAGGTPLLGICLGLQLLFEFGAEGGVQPGLGLLRGQVVRMKAQRLPHMGWNEVTFACTSPLAETGDHAHYYFAHSYAARPDDASCVTARVEVDGIEVPAAVARDRIFGVQFHPEKSGTAGLALLERFVTC